MSALIVTSVIEPSPSTVPSTSECTWRESYLLPLTYFWMDALNLPMRAAQQLPEGRDNAAAHPLQGPGHGRSPL